MTVPAHTRSNTRIDALTFVVPDNSHSFEPLNEKQIAEKLAFAAGNNGTNADYLFNLNQGLMQAGINPGYLSRLERQVRDLQRLALS